MLPMFIVCSLSHSLLQVNYTEGGREIWNLKWIDSGPRVIKYIYEITLDRFLSILISFLNFFPCVVMGICFPLSQ